MLLGLEQTHLLPEAGVLDPVAALSTSTAQDPGSAREILADP